MSRLPTSLFSPWQPRPSDWVLAAKLFHLGALLDALVSEWPLERTDLVEENGCQVMTITLDQALMLGVSWVTDGVVILAFNQDFDFHPQRGQQGALVFEARRPEELFADLPIALRPCLDALLVSPRLRRLGTTGLWATTDDMSRIGFPLSGEWGEEELNDFLLQVRPIPDSPSGEPLLYCPRYSPCGLAEEEYALGYDWVRRAHVDGPLVLTPTEARRLTNARSRLPRGISDDEARSRVAEFSRRVATVGLVLPTEI
jgi:hypothetical protein